MKNTKKAAPKKSTKKVNPKLEKMNLLIAKYQAFLLDIYTISKKEEIVFSSFIKKHKVSNSISKVLVDNYFVQNGRWATLKPNKSLASRIIELIREHNKSIRHSEPIMVATNEQINEVINENVSDSIDTYKARIVELEEILEKSKAYSEMTQQNMALEIEKIKKVATDDFNYLNNGYNSLHKDFLDLVKVNTKSEAKLKIYDELITDISSKWWYKALTILDKKIYVRILERFKLKS